MPRQASVVIAPSRVRNPAPDDGSNGAAPPPPEPARRLVPAKSGEHDDTIVAGLQGFGLEWAP
eukprot:8797737-Lingulodinium_polyedra.AAC.1